MISNWRWILMQLLIMLNWESSWRTVPPVAYKGASKASRRASTLFWVSAIYVPRGENCSSLASWTWWRLCSKIAWRWSILRTLFFRTELSLNKLKMERALQAAFRIGFPKTRPATSEAVMSVGTSRGCRWWVEPKEGGSIEGGAKEDATRNSSA